MIRIILRTESLHTYTKPIIVIATGYAVSENILISIGLIWIAHLAMDRTLGFGLKYKRV